MAFVLFEAYLNPVVSHFQPLDLGDEALIIIAVYQPQL